VKTFISVYNIIFDDDSLSIVRNVMSTLVPDAQQFSADSGNSDNVTRYHQCKAHQGQVPTTSSENTAESYLARLSAVGARTTQPHGGVRLAYNSRRRLSCEGAILSSAARNGLGGGRCIAREFTGRIT